MLTGNPLSNHSYHPGQPILGCIDSKQYWPLSVFQIKLVFQIIVLVLATSRVVIAGERDEVPKSSGTGFAISHQGHILTNHHVIDACPSVRVLVDGEQQESAVLATDKQNDLALLKMAKPTPNIARFRKGRGIRSGDSVVVVGFPYSRILASEANVTSGAVSALAGIRNDSRFLQISAPVQAGNSGGPVLDTSGHVVGIVESKLNALAMALITGDIPQNVNFAVKDAIAMSFLDSRSVIYEMASSDKQLEPGEIGELAKRFTYLIECYSETRDAKKRRVEAELRAQTEIKRRQEVMRERARNLEQEERAAFAKQLEAERKAAQEERTRVAKQLEAERKASEEEEAQRRRDLAEKEAAEMCAASERVIRFHNEERASEIEEDARRKGQEAFVQAFLMRDDSARRAALEARSKALNVDPLYVEEARRRGRRALAPLSIREEVVKYLDSELDQIKRFQPLPPMQYAESSKSHPFWARVESILMQSWTPPPLSISTYTDKATLRFRYSRDGYVSNVTVVESSGNPPFDQSAIRAVLMSSRLPSFPEAIIESHKDVEIVFRNITKRGMRRSLNSTDSNPEPTMSGLK